MYFRTSLSAVSLMLIALTSSGCNSTKNMHTQTVPDAQYREALKWTDPANYDLPQVGSTEEEQMLQSFKALFETYTHENLSARFAQVYAEKLYFRDAFKAFDTVEPLKAYMLQGLEPLEDAEFRMERIVSQDGEYYVDWTMRLDFKKTATGTWEESIGMTHIRFNSEGKVIIHQDYWDPTDIVYRRIPIAKQLIAFVKNKM
jgi:hypothetical protein